MCKQSGFGRSEVYAQRGPRNLSGLLPTGFTLIELLVVAAIIALLVSIMIPALDRAKKQAKAAICMSNLHQWGLIWQQYTAENNGWFPQGTGVIWERGVWIVSLRPEWETNSNILRCPMAMKRLSSGQDYGGPFNTYVMPIDEDEQGEPEEGSYGINCWVYNPAPKVQDIQDRPTKWNWRTPDVKSAPYVPLFGDTMWRGGGPYDHMEPPDYNGQWSGFDVEMNHFCIDRHGAGTINILFLGWSVRRAGLKELWKLKWHRQFDTNGPWTMAGGVQPNDWPMWMRGFRDY
ncbi:MAG: prepilin-type N-terminal cleavage/methylation domain-containing protein [Planctomycetota bacterium]